MMMMMMMMKLQVPRSREAEIDKGQHTSLATASGGHLRGFLPLHQNPTPVLVLQASLPGVSAMGTKLMGLSTEDALGYLTPSHSTERKPSLLLKC